MAPENSVSVPCPCGSAIPVAVELLVSGSKFSCPGCQASVSLAPTSRATAAQAYETLEALRTGHQRRAQAAGPAAASPAA